MRFDFDADLDDDATLRPPSPRLGSVMVMAALVAVLTTVALQLGAGGIRGATVPAVVGLTEADARVAAAAAKLTLVVDGGHPDAVVPAGSVASQQPLAGARVRPGTVLHVILSRGLPP